MNDIYSFYQLISKYRIEIPIIQRDYAQGRDNVKAADVRKSLVGKLVNTVENENETLFFDFVYGRVDENKFIPFDGQQRLTTLFLFHKYVFEKCQSVSDCRHKGNCICKDILGRFSYATRQSSREFCEELVKHDVIPDTAYRKLLEENYKSRLKEDDKEKDEKTKNYIVSIDNWIYRFITNQPWFYPDWQKDPTVMGMLTMLDEIHNQMKGKDRFKNYAEKLTSGCNCPITFHFVDMGEHKLSDETYVKMNARGKQLTPFENFKASLEQYIEEKKKEDEGKQKTYDDLLNRLKGQYDPITNKYTGIDGTWLELFWEVANINRTEKELPDTLMMSFFNRHFMNVWRCWYVQHQNADNDKINRKIIDEMPLYPTKDDFVSWDVYNEILNKCGVEECLIPIFNIWDILCEKRFDYNNCCQAVWNRGTSVEEKKLWNFYTGITNNNNRETYPSRIAFYALLKFFKENDENSSETLARWMRVVWNIIENSTIDSSDTYHAALRLIEKLSNKSHNIYDALANHVDDFDLKGQYHAMEQVAEEIAKAKQILNGGHRSDGKTWEEIIVDAEKYAFFKGSIRFLFTGGDGKENWCDFETKWPNAKSLIPLDKENLQTIELLIPFMADDDLKDMFSKFNLSNEDKNLKALFLDSPTKVHNFFMQQNKNENPSNLQEDLLYHCGQHPKYWIHKKWENGFDILSDYERKNGYYDSNSYIVGNVFFISRLNILKQIENIKISNIQNLLENDNKIWKGLFIEFEYNNRKFRWQLNDWVDMYNDKMENLWEKGLHSHYKGGEEHHFSDLDSLKKELDRCCSEYEHMI